MQPDAPFSLAALRKLIAQLLPTPAQLTEFCERNFPGLVGADWEMLPAPARVERLLGRATVAEVRYRLALAAPAALAHHTDYSLQVAAPVAPRPLRGFAGPRDPNFTGRAEQLGRVRGMLARQRIAIVSGPAGVGKTALVREFGYRAAGEYAVAWLVDGATPEALRAGLAELARQLHEHGFLVLPADADSACCLAAVRHFLSGRADWLLVVDELGSLAEVERWLGPGPPAGHLLGTTAGSPPVGLLGLELGALTAAEALQLLAQRSDRHKLLPGERAAVQRLALGLGYWPAALCVVADAVRTAGCTWTAALHQHSASPASEAPR